MGECLLAIVVLFFVSLTDCFAFASGSHSIKDGVDADKGEGRKKERKRGNNEKKSEYLIVLWK
jgi:hypothetical protein